MGQNTANCAYVAREQANILLGFFQQVCDWMTNWYGSSVQHEKVDKNSCAAETWPRCDIFVSVKQWPHTARNYVITIRGIIRPSPILTTEKNGHINWHLFFSSCVLRASKVSKTLFKVPTDSHYYKIIEMLKQFKNYNICYDMFRFTQEPSSGSSPVLS